MDPATEDNAKPGPAEHLKAHRFEKGKSGNPGGRPKGQSISARLRRLLDQEHNGKEIGEIMAERLIKDGLQGKLGHVKEILDRTEGAAKQTVEVQSRGYAGCIVLVPPEGATAAEIDRMGAEAAASLPPTTRVVIGRCWMDLLANSTRERGATVINADRPDAAGEQV